MVQQPSDSEISSRFLIQNFISGFSYSFCRKPSELNQDSLLIKKVHHQSSNQVIFILHRRCTSICRCRLQSTSPDSWASTVDVALAYSDSRLQNAPPFLIFSLHCLAIFASGCLMIASLIKGCSSFFANAQTFESDDSKNAVITFELWP